MDHGSYQSLARTAIQLDLFSTFKGLELDHLVSRLQYYSYDAGDVIFKKGDPSDALYIVHEGEIRIFLGRWYALFRKTARLRPGNLFGETGLLEQAPRRVTAVAGRDSKLFLLLQPDFNDLLKQNPAFAVGVRWLSGHRRF